MFARLRSRVFRLLRWSGLALMLALAALYVASKWWMFFAQVRSGYMLEIIGGRVQVARVGVSAAPGCSITRHSDRMRYNWRWNVRDFSDPTWSIHLPMYAPLAIVALPTFAMWFRYFRRHRFGPGCCPFCGYDLRGNRRDRCPECGARVIPEAPPASPIRSHVPGSPPAASRRR